MSDYSDQDIQEFVEEAQELATEAESELLLAEKGDSIDFYAVVFRAFHSIKGGAGMLGLIHVQNHLHTIESQWTGLRSSSQLSPELCQYFLDACDKTKKLLEGELVQFDYNRFHQLSSVDQTRLTPQMEPKKQDNTQSAFRGHICIIDDDLDIAEIISSILSEGGFHVTTFNKPREAIEAIQFQSFDCVITDYKMPELTGFEVLEIILKGKPDLPVILISGYLDKELLMSSISGNGQFWSVLAKPLRDTDVIQHTLSAVRQHDMRRAFDKSLNLLLYQFSDLEDYLQSTDKTHVVHNIKKGLRELLNLKKKISARQTSKFT